MDNLRLIKGLKEYLKYKFGNNISELVLFGSRLKGTAGEYSDFDIVLILENDYDWKYKREIYNSIFDYCLEKDIFIDCHLISKNEIEHSHRGSESLFQDALKNGLYA